MSFDLYLVPSSEFPEWTPSQWNAFFRKNPAPESFELGKARYVGRAVDAVIHNLENDQAGSRFPLFSRLYESEVNGWKPDEVAALIRELTEIRPGLAALPVNRATFNAENETEIQEWIADFREYNPDHPVRNLYDLYFRLFDTLAECTERAIATQQGIYLSY